MKRVLTTVRLPEKIVKVLDERAEEENADRTSVLREFLEDAIKNWKIEEGVKLYKEGRASLGEAARRAELCVGDMMDELLKRGIKSELSREEYRESLLTAFGLFGIKKGKKS